MVKVHEAEAQIITHYEVYGERPSDCDLLLPAIAVHEELLGRMPYLVTADAAFFSQRNENAAQAQGIKRVAIPNRSTRSAQRKRLEKKRWFRNAQKWRTGSEGRISLLKRRHGLNRCRYKGMPGIERWVGLGVAGLPRARKLAPGSACDGSVSARSAYAAAASDMNRPTLLQGLRHLFSERATQDPSCPRIQGPP